MLLDELFSGNIYPAETVVCKSKKYREVKKSADDAISYFEKSLSQQEYTRFGTMLDDLALAHSEENGEHFKNGFVFGMRLMQEIYQYSLHSEG